MQRCLVHVQRNVRTYLTLFTYLRTEFTGLDIASTTNGSKAARTPSYDSCSGPTAG
jgi:hypothetical protein